MSGTQRQVLVKEWVSGESGAPPENKAIEKIGYIKIYLSLNNAFYCHFTFFRIKNTVFLGKIMEFGRDSDPNT